MTETIEAHGLTPADVKIEVTEGVFIDARATLGWMNTVKEAGFRVVLDDFGTGYSSLAYLRKFPVSTLKVDKSFVWEMLEDDSAFAIVEAIVQMARALGMDVEMEVWKPKPIKMPYAEWAAVWPKATTSPSRFLSEKPWLLQKGERGSTTIRCLPSSSTL